MWDLIVSVTDHCLSCYFVANYNGVFKRYSSVQMKIPRMLLLFFLLFVFSACKEAHCHLDDELRPSMKDGGQ